MSWCVWVCAAWKEGEWAFTLRSPWASWVPSSEVNFFAWTASARRRPRRERGERGGEREANV